MMKKKRIPTEKGERLLRAIGVISKDETEKEKVNKNALLTVRLTQEELDVLKEIAEAEGQSMSAMIRERLPELNKI